MVVVSATWHIYSYSLTTTVEACGRHTAKDKTDRQSMYFFPPQMVYESHFCTTEIFAAL